SFIPIAVSGRSASHNGRCPSRKASRSTDLASATRDNYDLAPLGTCSSEKTEAKMHWFAIGTALVVATGIIVIGLMYLFNPRAPTQALACRFQKMGQTQLGGSASRACATSFPG